MVSSFSGYIDYFLQKGYTVTSVSDIDEKIPLPAAFLDEMKSLFADGHEYDEFLESYGDSPAAGLRINLRKGPREKLINSIDDTFSVSLPYSAGTGIGPACGPSGSTEKTSATPTSQGSLNFSSDNADTCPNTSGGNTLFSPVPWESDGFYYDPAIRPGKHPFHEMGLYYIQEPSAMSAVPLLDPQPGERVLDLCAAPGGKTTQIAGRMLRKAEAIYPGVPVIESGRTTADTASVKASADADSANRHSGAGLLISNEIHPARAKILSQNVERMGLSNVLVTNETPERLAKRFPAYFDRILVDAPCSGEGMFRKNPESRLEWSPGEVTACAERQRHLLDLAASMLRPGGRIVYSTCTFSKAEDEDVVVSFLAEHVEFSSGGCSRFFPHRQRGEGHFVAVLESCSSDDSEGNTGCLPGLSEVSLRDSSADLSDDRSPEFPPLKDRQTIRIWEEFVRIALTPEATALFPRERLLLFGEQLYLAPEYCPKPDKLRILRPGLHLGTLQKGRITPSHALALFLRPEDVLRPLLLNLSEERTAKYFAGEVISCEDDSSTLNTHSSTATSVKCAPSSAAKVMTGNYTGWTLVCVDGFSAGWGKASGGIIKNHYPKALRKKF